MNFKSIKNRFMFDNSKLWLVLVEILCHYVISPDAGIIFHELHKHKKIDSWWITQNYDLSFYKNILCKYHNFNFHVFKSISISIILDLLKSRSMPLFNQLIDKETGLNLRKMGAYTSIFSSLVTTHKLYLASVWGVRFLYVLSRVYCNQARRAAPVETVQCTLWVDQFYRKTQNLRWNQYFCV